MDTTRRDIIINALENILKKSIPNELKAHRIFMDILIPAMEHQRQNLKDQYEMLFFSDDTGAQ